MKILAVLIFFLTFYRVTFLFPYAYFALLFAFLGFSTFIWPSQRKKFFESIGFLPFLILFFIIFYSLVIDVITGSLFSNFTNTFVVRGISLVVISAFPAYFLVSYALKWDYKSALDIIAVAFWIQFLFWALTFFDPNFKYIINDFMGGSNNAVNLRGHNLEVRGFGISSEMNYTSPFMTVITCLLLVRRKALSIVSIFTQLINSNLVVVAVIFGLIFSRIGVFYKVSLGFLAFSCAYLIGDLFLPRLIAEFKSGESRTVNALVDNHLVIINDGYFGHLFGEFLYTFQGASQITSDIGWIHLYNYGGALFVLLFILFLLSLSISAFGYKFFSLVWFGVGLVLNTKGLLFSPNSFYFVTFVFAFLNYGERSQASKLNKVKQGEF